MQSFYIDNLSWFLPWSKLQHKPPSAGPDSKFKIDAIKLRKQYNKKNKQTNKQQTKCENQNFLKCVRFIQKTDKRKFLKSFLSWKFWTNELQKYSIKKQVSILQ